MNFRFEYDPQKSASNKSKHGIDFVEAQPLWRGHVEIIRSSVVNGEMRYVNLGKVGDTRRTAVVTFRGAVCRIISVYRFTPEQIARYEQRSQKP